MLDRKVFLWKLAYLFVAFAVFMLDQTTKAWAVRRLRFGGDMEVIPGFLNFSYAQNTGIAFSMLDDYGETGRWALSSVGVLAATLVLYYFWRVPRSNDRLLGALALILGGIAGNVTDRIRFGFVIDFIDFYIGSWHYPTFNVADTAIVAGVILLMIDTIFSNRQELKNNVS
ncbi:MAG: signal peptidase II [Acidobacteria bacterium]|jgi:signal peptidase II|nr:MAG: signal peptidase II [Acidobacteriota bacterium]GIU81221.1 MAG: lipoprotein signal peptidase [Pyrinomonadaceae bacterium]